MTENNSQKDQQKGTIFLKVNKSIDCDFLKRLKMDHPEWSETPSWCRCGSAPCMECSQCVEVGEQHKPNYMRICNKNGKSAEEIIKMIRDYIDARTETEWVVGPGKYQTAADLKKRKLVLERKMKKLYLYSEEGMLYLTEEEQQQVIEEQIKKHK